jgi:hypothetical protein
MNNINKNKAIYAVFIMLLCIIPAYTIEVEFTLGRENDNPWQDLIMLDRIVKEQGKWGYYDLVLDEGEYSLNTTTDLLIHFNNIPVTDISGNYITSQDFPLLTENNFILGNSSGAFNGRDNTINLYPQEGSIFNFGCMDFSIEFWLYPLFLNDGEEIITWNASFLINGVRIPQSFKCKIENRRLVWVFNNFFTDTFMNRIIETDYELTSITALLPKEWHHHILRFNSATGLLEYMIDGIPEAIIYITETGNEGSSVYTPVPNPGEPLLICKNYTGLVDELQFTRSFFEDFSLNRYNSIKGTAVSRIFDLKHTGSVVKEIVAEYDTPENTDMSFYYRVSNELVSYTYLDSEWIPFIPNDDDFDFESGRYLQLKFELLPDGKKENTPSLSEITVIYEPDLPPSPPLEVVAIAGNGEVTLKWQHVRGLDVKGYEIFIGEEPNNYVNNPDIYSPIDVGYVNSYTLNGLTNGKLYYFSIVTYDESDPPNKSIFSKEISARPQRILQ